MPADQQHPSLPSASHPAGSQLAGQGTDKMEPSQYVSNPFQVYIDSFQRVFQVNFTTLLAFVGIMVLVLPLLFLALMLAMGAPFFLAPTEVLKVVQEFSTVSTITVGWLLLLLMLMVWAVLQGAWTKYAMETARDRELSFARALAIGLKKMPGFIAVNAILALTVGIGLVLLIVPGVIFLYWFVFTPLIYIDTDCGVFEAFRESKRLVQGKLLELIGYVSATFVLGLPANLPLAGTLYGIIFVPISHVAFAYRYTSAKMLDEINTPKPETHVANTIATWLLAILAALFVLIPFVLLTLIPLLIVMSVLMAAAG